MSKDPAFLFYPGDYLRDTQCLSEKSQVAYDRIMCEHMRNICISQQQLNFFTKRLSEDEKSELLFILTQKNDGYQITWVADSIQKRKEYADSRRKNREKYKKTYDNHIKTYDNHIKTYDEHMENENENENEDINKKEKRKKFIIPSIEEIKTYCEERKNQVVAQLFFDFYQSKGWMIGKNKMKDWKAAVRTWEKNSFNKDDTTGSIDAWIKSKEQELKNAPN